MARKKKTSSSKGVSLNAAALAVGASSSTVAKWVKEDRGLAALLRPGPKGARLFSPQALTRLRSIHKRKMDEAPPSLRKAWAARRRTAKALRDRGPAAGPKAAPRRRSRVVKAKAASAAASGMSGRRAAEALGISVVSLYRRIKALGLKLPGKDGFSAALLQQLGAKKSAAGSPAPTKATKKARTRQRAVELSSAPKTDVGVPWTRVVDVLERKLDRFIDMFDSHLEQQRQLLAKATGSLRLKVDTEE